MELLSIFYVSNIIITAISVLLAALVGSAVVRYKGNPQVQCCRFYPFAILLLGGYKASTCFVVSDAGVEVFPTQSLCLLSACICVFAMSACCFLGRRHYLLIANWVLLLFPAVFLFFANQLMMHYGYYRPLYSFSELTEFRHATPIIFFARLTLISVMSLSVIFALGMVIEALLYDHWSCSNSSTINFKCDCEGLLNGLLLLWFF